MTCQVIDTGRRPPQENMTLDAKMLAELDEPVLHLYDWEGDAATFGHFVKPADFLHLDMAEKHGIQLAKRPTGGGIVFHTCDLAFSVLIPTDTFTGTTLETYHWVNKRVISAVKEFGGVEAGLLQKRQGHSDFCMVTPTIYDVIVEGKKVGGAAQRRTKRGFLHQGTICLVRPDERWREVLRDGSLLDQIFAGSHYLADDLETGRERMRHCLINAFGDRIAPC